MNISLPEEVAPSATKNPGQEPGGGRKSPAPASEMGSKSEVTAKDGVEDEPLSNDSDPDDMGDDEIYDLTELVTQKTSEVEKSGRFEKEYADVGIQSVNPWTTDTKI
jgi:hypothetical protein